MGYRTPHQFNVKNIAVIGAGPCGLAAAKYLVAQRAFESVVIFEQQDEVGGVWHYSSEPSQTLHVPQVSPYVPPDPPLQSPGEPPVFPSPMYDILHTNIPRALMPFSDLAFPDKSLIYPTREDVQNYLVEYARDIRHLIKFSTQVRDVRLRQVGGQDQWDVTTASLLTDEVSSTTFDALVVASGHYTGTYIPDIKGIKEFHKAHPGIISHSKQYRSPGVLAGKKVVVVGNAASGLDIAAQISPVAAPPLLLSVRTPTPPPSLEFCGAEEVPEIEEFILEDRTLRLKGGRVEQDVDAVIFATGYLFSFPFLTSLERPLVTDGRRVYGLYKHFMHIEHPTLVFSRMPIKVVPFPLSESQAAVFSRTWANQLPLPSKEEMRKWEEEEAERRGPKYHVWPELGDAEYINEVHKWLMRSGTPGKEPPYWGPELVWQRRICFKAKLEFEKRGCTAMTLEELGFVYQPEEERG